MSICVRVLQEGVVKKIGVFGKNFAGKQTELGNIMRSYIMTITGNLDLSKDSLHKSLNFMFNDEEGKREAKIEGAENDSVYSGKNYSGSFLTQMVKNGLQLNKAIHDIEERFLS